MPIPDQLQYIVNSLENVAKALGIEYSPPTSPTLSLESAPAQTIAKSPATLSQQPIVPSKIGIPRNHGSPNLFALAQTPPPPALLTRELSASSDSEAIGQDSPCPPPVRRISISGYTPYDRGIRTPGNCCILEAFQSPKHTRKSSIPLSLLAESDSTDNDELPDNKQHGSRRSSFKS